MWFYHGLGIEKRLTSKEDYKWAPCKNKFTSTKMDKLPKNINSSIIKKFYFLI